MWLSTGSFQHRRMTLGNADTVKLGFARPRPGVGMALGQIGGRQDQGSNGSL
jgi:hypothetical protein